MARAAKLTAATALAALALSAGSAHAIVNGTSAPAGSFPSVALIADALGGGETAYCTGTVVAANVILTAAHCLEDSSNQPEPASGFTVTTAAVSSTDPARQTSAVSAVLIDPQYDPLADNYDAGLLILSASTSAPAVALAPASDTTDSVAGTEVAVAGWGLTAASATSEPTNLQWAYMTIQTATYCAQWDNLHGLQYQDAYEFCASDSSNPPAAICHGDSGGPAFSAPNPGTLIEVGIVDRGDNGCSGGIPGIFTRANLVAPWVQSQIAAYPPPPYTPPPPSGGSLGGSPGGAPSVSVPPTLAAAASGRYAGSSGQHRGRVTLTIGSGALTAATLRYNLRCSGAWRGPYTRSASWRASPIRLVPAGGAWTFRARYRDAAGEQVVLAGRLASSGRASGTLSVTTRHSRCSSGVVPWKAALPSG